MVPKLASALFALLLPFTAQAEPTVQINTSLGPIVVELDSAKVQKMVGNFLGYVK